MAWMFDQNSDHTRRFISFTECTVKGKWDTTYAYVQTPSNPVAHPVFRALKDAEIIVTLSNGTRKQLFFNPNSMISIDQSRLGFRNEDVTKENFLGIVS